MSAEKSPPSSLESISSIMIKSEYDKVIFHDVADSYPTDADVECCYTLTYSIVPAQGDRVALFRVGWEAPHQYIKYEWAPVPEGDDKTNELSVLFKAQDLPMDDGDFYQFCYISADGVVRGASIPFRFRRLETEDLIEVEDNDNDLLIIRSRTAVIEEKLREVAFKNNDLVKLRSVMEKDLTDRQQQCTELEKKLKSYEETIEKLKEELEAEVKKRESATAQLLDKIEEAHAEKSLKVREVQAQMAQNDTYIREVQDTIRVLCRQKEELSVKLAAETKDKEALQQRLQTTEERMKNQAQKINQLSKELSDQQEGARRLQLQIRTLESDVWEEHKRNAELKEKTSVVEEERQHVLNQLVDAEHMLVAMEKSKHLATEELMAHTEFKNKVTNDLEATRSELHNMKLQHKSLDEEHKVVLQRSEELQCDYDVLQEEYKVLQKKYNELLEQQKSWHSDEQSLKAAVDDLMCRLKVGSEEFQLKYVECLKLDRKLNKLKKKYKEKFQSEQRLEKDRPTSPCGGEQGEGPGDEEYKENDAVLIERYESQLAEKEQMINFLRQELKTMKLASTATTSLLQQTGPAENRNRHYSNPPYYPYPCTAYGYPVPTNPFLLESSDLSLCAQPPSVEECDQSNMEDFADSASGTSTESLPPPILPEKTPQAKLAAIAAMTRRLDRLSGSESRDNAGLLHSFHLDDIVADSYTSGNNPSAPQDDSDEQCPVCGIAFGPGNSRILQDHMDVHFGQECPICVKHYGPDEQDQLLAHVQSHFQEEFVHP